ncbi:hypothetical protein FACS1894164_16400 [Spirochaetia bacterium]|nr:hypothetical protein FACS1894164_16400 [Spirochaetia bacterium]
MKRTVFLAVCSLMVGAFVSAQTLTIDYQYDATAAATTNYFTFTGGNSRLPSATKATDAASGTLFTTAYHADPAGTVAFSEGLLGLFLFPVSPANLRTDTKLQVSIITTDPLDKAGKVDAKSPLQKGAIVIQYINKGIAYRIITDAKGVLKIPFGSKSTLTSFRVIGTEAGVIDPVFSADGKTTTVASVDYEKVWNPATKPTVAAVTGSASKGNIGIDTETSPLFHWVGTLQATFNGKALVIKGDLKPAGGKV